MLNSIAGRIVKIDCPHTVRVAIDGVDAAGKTTFADELSRQVRAVGRPVIRAGIDSFHNPRAIRYSKGPESPEGYYRDSFDLEGLVETLLQPLGPNGTGCYRIALFDYREDRAVESPKVQAGFRAVLLFDGIFLLRPELRSYWDYSIFLKAPFDVTLARALQRDAPLWGDAAKAEQRYKSRYIPAQQTYLKECQPELRANLVLDNSDPLNLSIIAGSAESQS
jgi:uridine kinase